MRIQRYALFSRPRSAPKGARWTRVDTLVWSRDAAIQFYQSRLIGNALRQYMPEHELRLRAVRNVTI